jgi:hypothetical protein
MVIKRRFAVVVFRRRRVGGGGGEADFSTSLRSGRNDGVFFGTEGMAEEVAAARLWVKTESQKLKAKN